MKDYIVFFTDGFDKYNIDKQKKAYSEAFISTIDSSPNYAALKEEAKKAKEAGYDNFYIFWEKNDISSMTSDMKAEFNNFHETGALPYKYNKRITEGDTNTAQVAPNARVVNQPNATGLNQAGATQNIQNNQNNVNMGAANTIGQQQSQTYNELGTMNVTYSADHAASIYIWPINAYTSAKNMRQSLLRISTEFKKDKNVRSQTNNNAADTGATKKGNWSTLVYVPSSIKELGQNFANAAAMINEIANIYSTDIFPDGRGLIRGNVFFGIEKEIFDENKANLIGGFLDEASFLQNVKKRVKQANKNNIVIFCTESYKKYLSWCPKVVVIPGSIEPSVNLNNSLKEAFDRIESYQKATIDAINANPNDINSQYLNRLDFSNPAVINKYKAINTKFLNAFFSYYKWYLNYRDIDVYGSPNFSIRAKETEETEDSTEKTFKKICSFFDNKHFHDLEAFRKAIGLENTKLSDVIDSFKKTGATIKKGGKAAQDKINSIFKNNKELTPEEKVELERILAEYDHEESAENITAAEQSNVNPNTSTDTSSEVKEKEDIDKKVDKNESQDNNSKTDSKQDIKSDTKSDTKSKGQVQSESVNFDLVDIFMDKFYESEQQAAQTVAGANNAAINVDANTNGQKAEAKADSDSLTGDDIALIVRLFALTKNSGYKGVLTIDQALINFTGREADALGIKAINDLIDALEESKNPSVRQETLERLNKESQKEANSSQENAESEQKNIPEKEQDEPAQQNNKDNNSKEDATSVGEITDANTN